MPNAKVKQGFAEDQSDYQITTDEPRIGQFRRFGKAGPAYEIVGATGTARVAIRVVHSGEELEYQLDRARLDPVAETIP